MKQLSPAKLQQPMRRKAGTERGAGEFEAISWEEAISTLTERLRKIRDTDPNQLAYFTGRDQMQALTGFWASQFGTINWAAHGGFCSVNMAAAGLYTTGHAFWEFGDPDWDHAKYFMLWGVAEDHASNPIKIGLEKLKRRGAKFVAVNPVRTGYQAIADEWVPIRPGTDGLMALAMAHVLLKNDQFDWEFLLRYTNAAQLVVCTPDQVGDGLLLRDEEQEPLCWSQRDNDFARWADVDCKPALFGEYTSADGKPLKTVMTLMAERYLSEEYSPEAVAERCGISAETIERLALEMAHVAFQESITIDTPWVDWAGRKHEQFIGRPVAMHAMRGISAHSNGFQTARALHMLQILLGAVDSPGSHLAKPPFPRHLPPPIRPAKDTAPNTPLKSPPLGFPVQPEDLVIDEKGNPKRIDKAYSWEAPIANHGLMHMVVTNAFRGDPYPIDTLMFFMANMAWNSTMNTAEVQRMLTTRKTDGEYQIPFIVTVDAFDSEMVHYSDLVLPDTTYLERFDTISGLDRPISEPHAFCDSIRQPIVAPNRDVRPWQEVMLDIGTRLGFPALVDEAGEPKYSGYKDFITRWEKAPGIGFLAGWRGENQDQSLVGAPNEEQWERYAENGCFHQVDLPPEHRYYRFANKDYLAWSKSVGFNGHDGPIVMDLYSEILQKFRLAGEGLYEGPCPTRDDDKRRLIQYFDPLPTWYAPLEEQRVSAEEYPFHAVNQRPMFMYHSWDSQNAWLRQINHQNMLFMNRARGEELGLADESWVWVESHNGKIRVQLKLMEGVQSDTVWTWNAIGKQSGAWGLKANAPESQKGFLMNHLIRELLPDGADGERYTNSDPITGQAAWYDLRVKIYAAAENEVGSWPSFDTLQPLPGAPETPDMVAHQSHEAVNLLRPIADVLQRGEK
ncbi:MAG: molybdopterin oxidoreductase family protein, partial [Granulosicoccaceae bacterium]